ncbi:MAG: glycosyltransferase [Cytophagaceae bacterium]
MMELAFSILSLIYLCLLVALYASWRKIKDFSSKADDTPSTFISVIIPVRNEEKNIARLLEDLNSQSYPSSLFEVIVMNDHSSDGTGEIVRSYQDKVSFRLLIQPVGDSGRAYKKQAIETAIGISTGTLIMTTDGDCTVGREWIRTVESFYRHTGARFISSPVSFYKDHTFFKKLQSIEFASLIGSGAASMQAGFPNMCNGANIAYEKQAFTEAGGFSGNKDIPSGDDEFLMHKIFSRYPDHVFFLKSASAIVYTEAKNSLMEFLQQRKRWASKWGNYHFRSIKLLAIFIFLYNFSLLGAFAAVPAGMYSPWVLLLQIIPKICLEALLIKSVLRLCGKRMDFPSFTALQFLYPLYVVSIGLISRIGGYSWKGRTINQ